MRTKLDILNDIVNNGQFEKIKEGRKKIILDGLTASKILAVYKALSDKNKEIYMSWNWEKMANFAYKY